MVRTMSLFICFLIQISISKVWSSSLFPCVPSSFRTISCSPSNGPFFISAKPYLVFTPNVNYVPVMPSSNENCASQPDVNKLITQEITHGIEEEDTKIDEEDPITDVETVLEENEMKTNDILFDNDPVFSQENLEYTENIENSENMSLIEDTSV